MHLSSISLALRQQFSGLAAYSPSLLLDLTSGNRALDPRITFTRASNATVTNSDGVIAYAPHNLLTFSEQFDNSAFAQSSTTVSANATSAPDGTTTADKLIAAVGNGVRGLNRTATITAGPHTSSVFIKASEARWFRLFFGGNGEAWFDLVTGVVGNADPQITASISPVGNGWYRCSIFNAALPTSTITLGYRLADANGNPGYTGDGTSGLFVWGAQLNVGALQPYYPTTVKNLLGFTQEFDNAAWTKGNSSITANATTAPDGSLTADKLVEDTATSPHSVSQSITATAGAVYTVSIYAKAVERTQLQVRAAGAGVLSASQAVIFNLANGTTSNWTGTSTPTITPVGNGWYRCSISLPATVGAGALAAQYRMFTGSDSYLGDGTSGIFIWGAQLSDSASLDEYRYNPVAAPAAAAYYGPRFDYDPVTLAPKGLLIEEQRTNLKTFSESILTTNGYSVASATLTAVSSTTPISGVTTATKFALNSGADTGNSSTGWNFGSGVTLTASTAYTQSVYVKSDGADIFRLRSNVSGQVFDIPIAGPSPSPSGAVTACSVQQVGNGWARISWTFTSTASGVPGTRSDYWIIKSEVNDGVGGYLLTGAQLEAGAFATSYIPTTTTAAATRAADVAVMQGANFSNWYNQSEGTLFAEASTQKPTASGTVFAVAIDDGTVNNFISPLRFSGSDIRGRVDSGAVIQAQMLTVGVYTVNTFYKSAIGYKVNDFAVSTDGTLGPLDNSGSIPTTVNRLVIGALATLGNTGHVRKIAYYPRRLSNTELQGITV